MLSYRGFQIFVNCKYEIAVYETNGEHFGNFDLMEKVITEIDNYWD